MTFVIIVSDRIEAFFTYYMVEKSIYIPRMTADKTDKSPELYHRRITQTAFANTNTEVKRWTHRAKQNPAIKLCNSTKTIHTS